MVLDSKVAEIKPKELLNIEKYEHEVDLLAADKEFDRIMLKYQYELPEDNITSNKNQKQIEKDLDNIFANRKTPATYFDYCVNMSSTNKGFKTLIPLKHNSYSLKKIVVPALKQNCLTDADTDNDIDTDTNTNTNVELKKIIQINFKDFHNLYKIVNKYINILDKIERYQRHPILIPLKIKSSIIKTNTNKENYDTIKRDLISQQMELKPQLMSQIKDSFSSYLVIEEKNYTSLSSEEQKNIYIPKKDFIALDFGLRTLFASNEGDLFGKRFIDKLIEYDKKIIKIQKGLQQRQLKLSQNKRYKNIVNDLRNFIKNEVNRCFNRIIKIHNPKRIILEKLFFNAPNLSRRMNRLLSNCGRAAINYKVDRIKEKYGINTEFVNAAYTSQECPKCGYVDDKNRNGEKFECLMCGCKMHADVKGGVTIGSRSSCLPVISLFAKRESVLQHRINDFVERRKPNLHKYILECEEFKFKYKLNINFLTQKRYVELCQKCIIDGACVDSLSSKAMTLLKNKHYNIFKDIIMTKNQL